MDQTIRFCTSADGVRLAYAVSGQGPLLVLSSSWLSHLEHQWRSPAWGPWLEAFSREYTLLRYDARGCGLSDREAGEISFATCVGDLECVVDAAGFGRFALLGSCQGGTFATEYAARHPGRVSHLVLYGAFARGRSRRLNVPGEVEKATLLLDLTKLGWGKDNHALLQVWASGFQPGGTLEHLQSWSEQMRAATCADTAVRLLRVAFDADMAESARRIACPTLVIHAERDRVVPIEEARMLAGLIPDCRFVALDSENHLPLANEPAWLRLLAEVRGFLGEPGAQRVAARDALPLGDLTTRERNVLECIARGLDNSEIAASLALSEKTVRNHITRVFDKIGVEHRYQAIVRARDAGLGMTGGLVGSP